MRAGWYFDDATLKEGYARSWKPGQRQHRQRGLAKVKSRAYYRKNKNRLKLQSRLWRLKNKNKGAFRNSEKKRRHTVRKRRASVEPVCVSCTLDAFLLRADFAPPRTRGGPDGRRQREQPRDEGYQDERYYKKNKAKRKRQSLRQYKTRCKKNRRCVERRESWNENPKFYERGRPVRGPKDKKASVLTVPDIAFGIGPKMSLGFVHSLSSMTGTVTYEVEAEGKTSLATLPVGVFLRLAAFLTEEDLDAFFELVDGVLGEEVYEELDRDELRECAAMYGIDPESPTFRARCLELAGSEEPTGFQLDYALVRGLLENRAEGDDSISDEYDPHLFFGEVEEGEV